MVNIGKDGMMDGILRIGQKVKCFDNKIISYCDTEHHIMAFDLNIGQEYTIWDLFSHSDYTLLFLEEMKEYFGKDHWLYGFDSRRFEQKDSGDLLIAYPTINHPSNAASIENNYVFS